MIYSEIITALLVFAFGAAIGSFLNVVIWRMPRGQKISRGRSHCPFCSKELSATDLVPILSFIWRRGRCKYCAKRISYRYPLIELVTASLFLIAFYLFVPVDGLSWVTLFKTFFVMAVLAAIFVIDLEHYLILDKIVWPAAVVILILHLALDVHAGTGVYFSLTLQSLLGAIAGYLPFYLLWKISNGKWIGLGDAKLGMFLGVVFGFPEVWLCFFIAFFLGTLVAVPLLLVGNKKLGSHVPLGTFLAVAGILTLWFGEQIFTWYLGLIGFGV